jgi:hypothetical protein
VAVVSGRWGARLRRVAAVAAATALVALAGPPPPARADDVLPFVPWSSYLPGWTDEYVPSSENDCVAGRPPCLRATLAELARIFDPEARSCSHHAVFAMAYLRITQAYGWSRAQPGYYEDERFVNHLDAVFARYYTDAYWNWRHDRRAEVPAAWRIALDASRDRRVTGIGDLLLGMNAHIARDLPFVLAGVGLVAPDGSSRKRDYDKIEHFLDLATAPMLAEAAARFDPSLDDAGEPTGTAYTVVFQFISLAREAAWRNAEALVEAPTPSARARVAALIETEAAAAARAILLASSYLPPLTSTSARDAYCRAHRGDPAPLPYPFGRPTPYGP